MTLAKRETSALWRRLTLVPLLFAALVAHDRPNAALGQGVCGDANRDFQTEDCDDGGSCQGGANDGQKCTTVGPEACPDGECVPVDGDLDFPVPGGERGDECPFDCTINRTCPSTETVDVTVKFAQSCPCAGDCDGDGDVDLNEAIIGVSIGLGTRPVDDCESFDQNEDEIVAIDELVDGVNSVVNECPDDCGVDLTNGRFFFRYPDTKVGIPGQANDQSVIERIALPFIGVSTPNDLDYAIRILLSADFGFVIEPDGLFTTTFNVCQGSEPIAAEDFRCTVFEAFASDASDVTERTTCSVEVQP